MSGMAWMEWLQSAIHWAICTTSDLNVVKLSNDFCDFSGLALDNRGLALKSNGINQDKSSWNGCSVTGHTVITSTLFARSLALLCGCVFCGGLCVCERSIVRKMSPFVRKRCHSQLAAIYYDSAKRPKLKHIVCWSYVHRKQKTRLCVCTHMTNGERLQDPWDSTNGPRSMTKKNEEVKTTLPRNFTGYSEFVCVCVRNAL